MTTMLPARADPTAADPTAADPTAADQTVADPTTAVALPADPTPVPPLPGCPTPRVRCLLGGPRSPRLVPSPPASAPAVPYEDAGAQRAITAAMRTALEVLDGRRPATHLGQVFDASALRYWQAERARAERANPSRLVRLRVELPCADAAEVAAVCTIHGRVRALAARFERREQEWWCTSIRLI